MSVLETPLQIEERELTHVDAACAEKGRVLCSSPCTFLKSVFSIQDLPILEEHDRIEVCFAGRSNVGKSSLINAIMTQKSLAKTSNTPGRTQCLNYFSVGEGLFLVDMPGYGYAKAPKKLAKSWQGLIKSYLLGRPTLMRVFLLIDSRHGLKENDLEMMKMLDKCAVNYQILLTKGDKISQAALNARLIEVQGLIQKNPAAHPFVHVTSSEKGWGIDGVRAEIAHLVEI